MKEVIRMNLPRSVKQVGLLIIMGCWLVSLWLLYTKAFATQNLTWLATIAIILGLITASALILWVIVHTGRLPTTEEVRQVVEEIRATWAQGIKSYKGKLHFYFPPRWRIWKLGKEGWLIRPKGLGAPVGFSIWAVTRDPEFVDTSFNGMVRNVQDMATHNGGTFDRNSVTTCKIAGVEGITYWQRDLKGHDTLGFFWCYEDGDYTLLVDAYSRRHIELIRPAVDEFICHFEMR
jgi:hypothetical protein